MLWVAFTCVLINLTFRVETCFLSMLGLRAILCELSGQFKGRRMLSINVGAKGNTVRIVRPLEG